nr:tetraacyldisaccharide 4'-kinase [Halorhodospira halophila]
MPARALAPLAALYGAGVVLRRGLYQRGWLHRPASPVPVIVVGNLFVGGTGKTPLVAWLVTQLREYGWHPAIVARGYGGRAGKGPVAVTADSDPADSGDEPLLLARRCAVPVFVGSDRPATVQAAYQAGCDVVVSDDGLQHYRMRRDAEIVVLDAHRRLGNRRLLPAGPLREPIGRLAGVDIVAVNGDAVPEGDCVFHLQPGAPRAVDGSQRPWPGGEAHAVAGIGHPERFFASLQEVGIGVAERHVFPDHHAYSSQDLSFADERPIIMTEKDAVKCRDLPQADRLWYLPVELEPGCELTAAVSGLLTRLHAREGRV